MASVRCNGVYRWDNWRNPENEKTARYAEYNNTADGAQLENRVKWCNRLDNNEAHLYEDLSYIFSISDIWLPRDVK